MSVGGDEWGHGVNLDKCLGASHAEASRAVYLLQWPHSVESAFFCFLFESGTADA